MPFLNLFLPVVFFLSLNDLPWLENLQDAKVAAQREGKLILLVFSGSDWCRNCILLDHEVFSDPEFQVMAEEQLVLLKADFPRKKKNQLPDWQQTSNEQLAVKFNPQGTFPKVLLMGPDEDIVLESGYQQGQKNQFLKQLRAGIRDK